MAYVPFSEMSDSRAQLGIKQHPRRRGNWIECVADLQIVQYRNGHKPLGKALNLPTTPILDEEDNTGAIVQDNRAETKPPQTEACPIVGLPAEILTQIAKYLVPTGQVYHIFHTSVRDRKFTIINAMSKPSTAYGGERDVKPIRLNLTSLASTCKKLSEVYQSVIYGNNDFVFSRITGSGDPKIHLETHLAIESWCRVYEPDVDKDGALWPLTGCTLNRFVKQLTFAVSTPCSSNSGDLSWLREELNSMLSLLEPNCGMKRLTIDISDIPRSSRARSSNFEDHLSAYVDDIGRLRLVARRPCSLELSIVKFAEQVMHSAGVAVVEEVLLNGCILDNDPDAIAE